MVITEEQRRRAEANRLAAIAKQRALIQSFAVPIPREPVLPEPTSSSTKSSHIHGGTIFAVKFLARLEICSADSFCITPVSVKNFAYPGEAECFRRLLDCFSEVIPSHYTQNSQGGNACVFKLSEYDAIHTALKNQSGILVEKIPFATLNVLRRLSCSSVPLLWEPCRPEHLRDEEVDQLIKKIPCKLLDTLLPFQIEGLRFGLRRGGRCLIADEMGLGKTLQAIAIACCYMNEGPLIVVCPAVLRYTWAEELEKWMPLGPSDIHLVFGHRNNPALLPKFPRVIVISYKMLHYLQRTMHQQEWGFLIVDESHHVRCGKKKSEPKEIKAVIDLAANIKHIVLLSGTPSLSRTAEGKVHKDFSKGVRLQELNMLLKQTVMIRRLKDHVLNQLPPKRRQLITLMLKKSDIAAAKAAVGINMEVSQDTVDPSNSKQLTYQELGIAKISGFKEWFLNHPIILESDGQELDSNCCSQKIIIFAHHHKVLDRLQEFICEKEIGFVRIDGNTLARDRHSALISFQSSSKVKVAIVGITAGGVGLDFSASQNVVFLELPQCPSLLFQAEDRAHRRGQTSAVNVYIFCAKDTMDERLWRTLNKSLHRVSSTTNGKYDAIPSIQVDQKCYLPTVNEKKNRSVTAVSENALSGGCDVVMLNTTGLEKHDAVPESIICTCDSNSTSSCLGVQTDGLLLEEPKFYLDSMKGDELENSKSIDAQVLRFEVSKYTGRIHLYSCIPELDTRPQLLCESFRPEELDSISGEATGEKEDTHKRSKSILSYKDALLAFINEWNKLRPIQRRKLLGKALQLPLENELSYLDENISHNSAGLLHGGSKRRITPWVEISHPLPSNAVWKTVSLSSNHRKKERQYIQGWTVEGDPLCKLCQNRCLGSMARNPEHFEDLFCKYTCYEQYRIRTSASYLRQELYQVEHGICANCRLDCHKLVKTIKPLSLDRRREYIQKTAPRIASRKKLLEKLVVKPLEGNAWHADHIVPVYKGGGECQLENMRTLCVACHHDVTILQHAERRLMKAKAKKRLKVTITNFKPNSEELSAHASVVEDTLLIDVPGSSYSTNVEKLEPLY